MPRTKFSATDLSQLHRQLDSWRQSEPQRARLPEAVWASAATLATTHGVSCVARTLGLDYTKLKRRATQAPGIPARTTPPPTFVELQLLLWNGNPAGAKTAPLWRRIAPAA